MDADEFSEQGDESHWVIEIAERQETAVLVYQNLWKGFFLWEQDYSKTAISGLSGAVILPPSLPAAKIGPTIGLDTADGTGTFIVEDKYCGVSGIPCEPIQLGCFDPYPRYTSCTPANRNFALVGRPQRRARFPVYADDPNFKLIPYLKNFEDFLWQNDYPDPDFEMIQCELAHRLHFRHDFTLEEIDALGMLDFHLRDTNKSGLIWYSSQRDYVWWPDSEKKRLQSDWVNPELDLYGHVIKDTPIFCPNLNCLHSHCSIHTVHPILPAKPTGKPKSRRDPCKNDCYMSIEASEMNMTNSHWDKSETSFFANLMKLVPDTSPCDLAIICRKSCIEMYVEWLKIFPDDDEDMPGPEEDRGHESAIIRKIVFDDPTPGSTKAQPTLVQPCYHLGMCNQFTDCSCYQSRQRCTRSCRCTKSCELRFQGCKCGTRHSKNRQYCVDPSTCICKKLSRECDPELCRKCEARKEKGKGLKCWNTDLQKQNFYPIQIKTSKWGLGAYALTKIPEGAYIGEYVGEVIHDIDRPDEYIEPLQGHSNLNYSFELSLHRPSQPMLSGTILDAWNVGNETRYLNHSKPSNCISQSVYVNGEFKIVIVAVPRDGSGEIPVNEELTLDYGDIYWKKADKPRERTNEQDELHGDVEEHDELREDPDKQDESDEDSDEEDSEEYRRLKKRK